MAEKPKLSEMLSSFVIVWAIRLSVALFALTFLCGVIVILLRYVSVLRFGIHFIRYRNQARPSAACSAGSSRHRTSPAAAPPPTVRLAPLRPRPRPCASRPRLGSSANGLESSNFILARPRHRIDRLKLS